MARIFKNPDLATKEVHRISQMFGDLYDGDPWIEVNLMNALLNISARQAGKKLSPDHNSIWEIVNHLIDWRRNVLERIQGKVLNSPANNYFYSIRNNSAADWKETLNQLQDSQKQWTDLLEKFTDENLEKIYPGNGMSYYEHIHGIMQHDAYHLGQINLLVKLIR